VSSAINYDTDSIAVVCSKLGTMGPQELVAVLPQVMKRYGIRPQLNFGYSGDPTGLAQQTVLKDGVGSALAAVVGVPGNNALITTSSVGSGGAFTVLRVADVFKDIPATAIVVNAAAGVSIWTPAAGKKFRLLGGIFSLVAAGLLILGDGIGGVELLRVALAAGISIVLPAMGNGILSAAANNALSAYGTATNLNGVVFGTEE